MNESLDRFLSGNAGQATAVVEQPVAAAKPPTGEVIAPVETPETPASEQPVEVVPAVEDEDVPPASNNGMVPVHALHDERNKRRDHKERADRAEEMAKAAQQRAQQAEVQAAEQFKAMQAQLEELKKALQNPSALPAQQVASQQQQPVQPDVIPDRREDPEGYADWKEKQEIIRYLNLTEESLRDKEGDEAVDQAIDYFKGMREKDPSLQQRFLSNRNPYKFMYAEVKKAQAAEKIGTDPDAYIAKQEAQWREKYRAEIEAELAAKAAAVIPSALTVSSVPTRNPTPAVVLPRSLATASSSAPRSAPAWTGPTPLGDILPRR